MIYLINLVLKGDVIIPVIMKHRKFQIFYKKNPHCTIVRIEFLSQSAVQNFMSVRLFTYTYTCCVNYKNSLSGCFVPYIT